MSVQNHNLDQDGNEQKENFWINELKERSKIKQKSKQFKNIVDEAKKIELERIEEESMQSKLLIDAQVTELESVLCENNPEKIKELLRNMT